ncbi:MAG: alpha/beta hydrolase [Planctomycetes bacterium]|nr:alpha/beta hydrolase [Planctomycetota bacterium]
MLADLVYCTTRDDVRLDAAFYSPVKTSSLPFDAIGFIHGTGGNFYSSTLFDDLAAHFLECGCAVLRANTRGHDGISTAVTIRGVCRQGAAYEVLDDCRHDLAAWLAWLRERAGPRVALLGHSSGAVKSLYAVCHEPRLAPICLIALSPPRLSYGHFCLSDSGDAFRATYENAERLVSAGQATALMDVKVPLPFVITAAGFIEKYGPEERYNFMNFIRSIPCPALITFGGIEVANNMAFAGSPETLKTIAVRQPLHVATILGADHGYTGVRPALWTEIETWLSGGDAVR